MAMENKDMLLEAWHQEQQIQQEKKMKVNTWLSHDTYVRSCDVTHDIPPSTASRAASVGAMAEDGEGGSYQR